MSATIIRPYRPSDLAMLRNIMYSLIPVYFGEHEILDFEKYLFLNGDTYFVAEQASTIIGGGGYHLTSPLKARLSWYLISPDHRGQGIGKSLANLSIAELSEKGISHLEVWTSQHAEKFFANFGFETESRAENYWAPGIHLSKMVKK